jgi:hypothetical protein
MDELLIRPNRVPGLLVTVFFVGMFVMNFYGFFVKPDVLETGSFVMGVVFQAMCAFFVALGVARIFTPALRLTSEGFAIGNRMVAWSNVDKFELPEKKLLFQVGAAKNVRVRYVPGFKRGGLDVALGSIGLGSAPTYVSGMFYRTDDQRLLDILRRYWLASA